MNRLSLAVSVVVAASLAAVATALAVGTGPTAPPSFLGRGFALVTRGPDGGSVWGGVIPNPYWHGARRPSLVYLPPRLDPRVRYPVVFLLHGMPGSPFSYVRGLRLPRIADTLIAARAIRPLVIVMPVAGPNGRYDGEWTSIWERFVVRSVVPWADAHLPIVRDARGRTIAGMSAGGFGAVDIALRHPGVFGAVESWSGYFRPMKDGSLARAGAAELAAHDPLLLVRRAGARLRRDRVCFFLSSGSTGDLRLAAQAVDFARELRREHVRYDLVLRPGGHRDRYWRRQLPGALRAAGAAPCRRAAEE